jgi:hypothetical protein
MNQHFGPLLYTISVWALPAIIAITFHEAAHGFVALRFGDDTAGYPNLQRDKDGKVVPKPADTAKVNWFMTEAILAVLVVYAAMVYGPIAAFLVELFPTRVRYTSLSLPYHIGAGVFGGMLPLLATAIVAATGNIYNGLWYPIAVAVMTAMVGGLLLHDTKDVDITLGSGVEAVHLA